MEVVEVFHVNKGKGEASYAKNCSVQGKIISQAYPMIEKAVREFLRDDFPESMAIADLGCSSGPNTFTVILEIIDVVHATSRAMGRPMPEFKVSLNDLPRNDFNNVFVSLPAFYNKLKKAKGNDLQGCYISGVPGTFYGRLFPQLSQNFIHSSTSLQWLSQVPPELDINASTHINKGKIYISKTSPVSVHKAYLSQFQNDFCLFLKLRSHEMIRGGCMVLSFLGRRNSDPSTEECCYQWELLARALMSMASEGLTQEEKINSFNFPCYLPSIDEVKNIIEGEDSFTINGVEAFDVYWDACCGSSQEDDESNAALSRSQRVSIALRAVVESMLEFHFGKHIMDELFARYSHLIDEYYSSGAAPYWVNLVFSLTKKA